MHFRIIWHSVETSYECNFCVHHTPQHNAKLHDMIMLDTLKNKITFEHHRRLNVYIYIYINVQFHNGISLSNCDIIIIIFRYSLHVYHAAIAWTKKNCCLIFFSCIHSSHYRFHLALIDIESIEHFHSVAYQQNHRNIRVEKEFVFFFYSVWHFKKFHFGHKACLATWKIAGMQVHAFNGAHGRFNKYNFHEHTHIYMIKLLNAVQYTNRMIDLPKFSI